MATHQITLPLRGRLEETQRSSCLACLQRRLRPTQGVIDLSIKPSPDGQVGVILDYDPRLVTLSHLEQTVRQAGVCLSLERVERIIRVRGMVSPATERTIEAELAKLPTVVSSASFASRTVRVEFDHKQCNYPAIVDRLQRLGLTVEEEEELSITPGLERPATTRISWVRQWVHAYPKFAMALVGGLLVLAAFLIHHFGGPLWLRLTLVIPAYILTGWFTGQDTFRTLRQFKFDVDVLMFAAALGAAALGQFEEGALLLFLFAIGTGGEEMAMDKARHAISALAKLAPETAIVRSWDGQETTVRVDSLEIGDSVVVRPFDRVAADGHVVSGASAVDQSPITGESIPAEKTLGDRVFAGTINGEGLLVVKVDKRADQSTLARVVRMVNEAQTAKSPTQVFTDRVERWYVPIVLISTALLVFIPPLIQHGGWIRWFYRSMAFLTAASPCALAIGTPAAVLSGIARAARIGVLIKGGIHLENLGRVQVIAFDKTGTLTRGKPELTDIVLLSTTLPRYPGGGQGGGSIPDADPLPNELIKNELLALAAAVERNSSHPLARAITAEAAARACPVYEAADLEQVPAKGVRATVNGRRVEAGHASMLGNNGCLAQVEPIIKSLADKGRTTVVLAVDGKAEAVFGLADQPRDNASESLARLRELGIQQCIMLTGDHANVAGAMAAQIGVDRYFGDLLPEHKVDLVRKLNDEHGQVAMVGDGVNDAPAMAAASVGIAMGGAGTDVALETADVALMADDLAKLPQAIGLSRMSRRIIKQNLAIALGVIAVVAPIAALGGASLSVAVLLHEGSTVVVVCNALRLLFYKPRV